MVSRIVTNNGVQKRRETSSSLSSSSQFLYRTQQWQACREGQEPATVVRQRHGVAAPGEGCFYLPNGDRSNLILWVLYRSEGGSASDFTSVSVLSPGRSTTGQTTTGTIHIEVLTRHGIADLMIQSLKKRKPGAPNLLEETDTHNQNSRAKQTDTAVSVHPSTAFRTEEDAQAGLSAARLEHHKAGKQDLSSYPSLLSIHSVALSKSSPHNAPHSPHTSNKSIGYSQALLAPEHPMSVRDLQFPTISKWQPGAHQSHRSGRGTDVTTSKVSIVGKVLTLVIPNHCEKAKNYLVIFASAEAARCLLGKQYIGHSEQSRTPFLNQSSTLHLREMVPELPRKVTSPRPELKDRVLSRCWDYKHEAPCPARPRIEEELIRKDNLRTNHTLG
ncbi:hypothetical protein AAY473_030908 [Plecturocebus cupreus]